MLYGKDGAIRGEKSLQVSTVLKVWPYKLNANDTFQVVDRPPANTLSLEIKDSLAQYYNLN